MPFFKRGPEQPAAPADFWAWWTTGRDRIAEAIATGRFDPALVEEISRAVNTIHPAMAWELAPGQVAKHAFCVSSEGNAEVRQAALRWLAGAVPADDTWEFHAAKQPARQLSALRIGSQEFDLNAMRIMAVWHRSRRKFDVRLWHPRHPEVPPGVRLQLGFVFLDKLLGEDDVERWIGQVELAETPIDGLAPADLRDEVEWRGREPAGEDTWIVVQLPQPDGSVAIASVNAAIKRIDHPFLDHHVTITTLIGADRMPHDVEAATLNAEEDDLLARLGDVALFVGHVTASGQRTMHFVAEIPDRMRPAIDAWAAALPEALADGMPARRVKVNFQRDMPWSSLQAIGVG